MKRYLLLIALASPIAAAAAQEPIDSVLARFYAARWWQPAWLAPVGTSPAADALLALTATADRNGLNPADYLIPELESLVYGGRVRADRWRLDSLLTRTFLTYARDVSHGRVDPGAVDSQWTAAPSRIDLADLLERALAADDPEAVLRSIEPAQVGYLNLRAALWRYRDLAEQGAWPSDLASRLTVEGYDTTAGIQAAVRRFQALHGLVPDGKVGPVTRAALNVPAAVRAGQITLNLERWRWLPRSLGERYVVVNSAAFQLDLVENGAVTFSTRAVVGRPDWPTPIVSSRATHIVFRPVWRVPRAIAAQELLPLIRRDPTYLARAGIRVFGDSSRNGAELNPRTIDWHAVTESTFAYHLAQEPGLDNPLGAMKLVFWTPFSVFIHDTPIRSSFKELWRALSHGCVRIEDAPSLAARLLPSWPADSLHAALSTGRQRWVQLAEPIGVHLVYWSTWVTEEGLVAFGADPYGWDAKLARALEPQGALIP
ncbi:MAG TPA: L,D-transpeptidase family protein [Gemmatimonadales bacterium]|nr:L,D-transpeptidase family protein [Gemmatimonadales bacterium]